MPRLWHALLCSLWLLAACTSAQPRRRPAFLKVVAEPAHAVVYVDETFVAPARKLVDHPAPLRPGERRLTVKASGYFPHDLVVPLAAGVTTVRITLRPIPP